MKNSECTIFIMFKDRWIQKFRKEKERWILTSSNKTRRSCTAEQMISHLLPALAGVKGPHVTVKVEPDEKIETKLATSFQTSTLTKTAHPTQLTKFPFKKQPQMTIQPSPLS